jgi:cell division transport system permease protein
MAMNLDYAVRETWTNLRRNVVISIASVLCVTVSLSLVGVALMARQGVERATQRWQDGVEFIVFVAPDASEEQIDSVGASLESNPLVERVTFFDQEQAYQEFSEMFADSPDMVETVTPDILPPSFRVVPTSTDLASVEELVQQYESQPGVIQVARSTEAIVAIKDVSDFLTGWALGVALVLLVVAVLIILTTIQLAIFTRRREIEVMRLVGASKAFIRVPFMAEGLVQGLVGALLAIAALRIFQPVFENSLPSSDQLVLFSEFTFSGVDMLWTYLLLGGVGAGIGTAAAAIAVTWFLDA